MRSSSWINGPCVGSDAANLHDQPGDRVHIARRATAEPTEQRGGAQASHQRERGFVGQGGDGDGDVGQGLGLDTAEPHDDHGPELRVASGVPISSS